MKPVALLQHDKTQRPGYLLAHLEEIGVTTRTFFPEEGDDVPRLARDFSGIVLLGSNRSVNDGLPWMRDEARLVRNALHADVPLLGHCFGAQMMAASLGGRVCVNACPNIGWQPVRVTPAATAMFGAQEVVAFHWHYETFTIPPGAQRLLFGRHCLNKAFAIGRHLAFQCHFEVTQDIVAEWCRASAAELSAATGPAVQSHDQILSKMKDHLPAVHHAARRVYTHWASSLARRSVVAQVF